MNKRARNKLTGWHRAILFAVVGIAGCSVERGGRSRQTYLDSGSLSCLPSCNDRVCGPDPVCGESCGRCTVGSCTAGGQCDVSEPAIDAGSSSGTRDAGPTPNQAPRILSLSSNISTMNETQSLIVTAVVTDPNGVDDLIGGTLDDPSSDATYGAFTTSAAEGSYSLTLSWGAINTVNPLTTTPGGTGRSFRVRFYDVAGSIVSDTFTITMKCAANGYSACDGTCVDLQTDKANCGACGAISRGGLACRSGDSVCADSTLDLCGGTCIRPMSPDNCGSCDLRCPRHRDFEETCVDVGVCSATDSRLLPDSPTSCTSICAEAGYACSAGNVRSYSELEGPETRSVGCGDSYAVSDFPTSSEAPRISCTCSLTLGTTPTPTCTSGPENTRTACSDGCSNDGDRFSDCEDFDCCGVVSCAAGTACGDR